MNDDVVTCIINEAEDHNAVGLLKLPESIERKINLNPAIAIDFIKELKKGYHSLEDVRTKTLFLLIEEALIQILYCIDRKDQIGLALQEKVQKEINLVIPLLPMEINFALKQVISDSRLDVVIDENPVLKEANNKKIDIMPTLPVLLENLRRKKAFRTSFELCELIMPQIQSMPPEEQLSIIAEMAYSKKPIAHELSILMLLHPKAIVRKRVAKVIYNLSDEKVFNAVDLRRLILIRNWIPADERKGIDQIILHLRKNNLSPAPYFAHKATRIIGSSMDGAGVACIILEIKQKNNRIVTGFLVKHGVGVKDPWVTNKVPKVYLDKIISRQSLPIKSISQAYVNKVVQHFLFENINNGLVPDISFVEIAELISNGNWQPQPLIWSDEINRLRYIYKDQLTPGSINKSLEKSDLWPEEEELANSWFETGDVAEQAIINSTKEHKKSPKQSLKTILAEKLMHQCLEKWKTIFLVTCLWMRSKEKHKFCFDLFVILHCIDKNFLVSELPLICNIAEQTMLVAAQREFQKSFL